MSTAIVNPNPPSAPVSQRLLTAADLAALALRPDGLMVQIHPDPDHAMSDGFQALAFPDFAELMGRIYAASART